MNLTPLGLWAAREALMEEGFEAPLAGELVSRPLEQVCEALRHTAPDLAESVMTEWVGVRPSAEADGRTGRVLCRRTVPVGLPAGVGRT